MKISLDINNLMEEFIGPEHGLSEEEISECSDKAGTIHEDLRSKREQGDLPFYDLPYNESLLKEITEEGDKIAGEFSDFVVLGIGGSALGGIALQRALNHPYYNLLDAEQRNNRPRIYFLDNIDPDGIQELSDILDLRHTCFNAISKSGTTAETNAQFLLFLERLKKTVGAENVKNHIILTTDAKKGNFRKIASKEGFKTFTIPDGVGGRFSVFTPVGLLFAAVAGIDCGNLLAGAQQMDALCCIPDIWENPAYLNGICHYLMNVKKGKSISVMLAYADRLYSIADWYRQLWAESLGKKYSLTGELVYTGQTPIKALGVTDQHSQIQLYIEGPNDKVHTFLTVQKFKNKLPIPPEYEDNKDIAYLGGHTINELFHAEQLATELALTKNNRPNCTIAIPEITPATIGQLLFMLEVQTVFSGGLYQINPLDQPGVEEGKKFTYGILGREGFAYKRDEMESTPQKNPQYIV